MQSLTPPTVVPASDDQKWVKVPFPGQFRGEGVWVKNPYAQLEWEDIVKSGYLPTHVGQEPPKE